MLDNTTMFPSFPTSGMNTSQTPNNRFQGAFPDPYLDYASTQMPRSIYDVLRWAEFSWLSHGTYRMAMQRVVRYFLTKVELMDVSDAEREKYEDFMVDHLHLMDHLAQLGDTYMAYGNAFISLHIPFRRNLRCPKCVFEQPIERCSYKWLEYSFHMKCPKCSYDGKFDRVDRRSIEQDKMRLLHWSPHEIKILNHTVTGETIYFWEIPANVKRFIERGNEFYLQYTPWEVVEAIREKKLFRFSKDVIYHMKAESLAGIREFGWGIPLILGNFKQAWYIQVLKRYNEAIALDYIIPFRVITPAPGTSREADPLLHMNLASFQNQVLKMFQQHRRDPTAIHSLPFAVNFQMMGAEGRELTPNDLLDAATDEFLNAQGVPAEMYRGSLSWQALPGALRLFERTWSSYIDQMNMAIAWLFKRVSEIQNWENIRGRLQPVTLADDVERKNALLNLMSGQQISKQTALAPFDIDVREETKRILAEQQAQEEAMAKFQEETAKKQQLQQKMVQGAAGQVPPGQPGQAGQPAPAGQPQDPAAAQMTPAQAMMPSQQANTAGASVQDMAMQAEQLAQQLLAMSYEQRRSEMSKIKQTNETLHSLVKAEMEGIRSTAKQQGGQAWIQQNLGGGGQ